MELKLQQDDFLPLRNVVFNTLRDAILRGELPPVERILRDLVIIIIGATIIAFAVKYIFDPSDLVTGGVSGLAIVVKNLTGRYWVYEVPLWLENEGLAITFPRRGAKVAKMSEKDLDDVLEIREVLDILAISLSCDNMTDDDIKRLEDAAIEFEKATKGKDVRLIVTKDEEFHRIIYECSRNSRLVTILSNLKEQMYRFRFEYVKDPSNYPTLIKEHREILCALRARNKEQIVTLTKTHLVNQMECVREIIKRQE